MRVAASLFAPGIAVGFAVEESVRPTCTLIVGLGGHCAMAMATFPRSCQCLGKAKKKREERERERKTAVTPRGIFIFHTMIRSSKQGNKLTTCDLDQVCHADVELCRLGPQRAAYAHELRILWAGGAFVTEDDGAITSTCIAVVEGQANGSACVIVASGEEIGPEVRCHGAPDGRTISLGCGS